MCLAHFSLALSSHFFFFFLFLTLTVSRPPTRTHSHTHTWKGCSSSRKKGSWHLWKLDLLACTTKCSLDRSVSHHWLGQSPLSPFHISSTLKRVKNFLSKWKCWEKEKKARERLEKSVKVFGCQNESMKGGGVRERVCVCDVSWCACNRESERERGKERHRSGIFNYFHCCYNFDRNTFTLK